MTSHKQRVKNQRHHFANKGPSSQSLIYPVVIYKCESWTIRKVDIKNWCFWTAVLEKTLESPLDSKEIKSIHPKGNQPWIFIGSIDAEAEAPIFWSPDTKSWLIGKDSDAGKDWGQQEKGETADEMVGCYHRHNGHEFEQTLGDSERQGSLTCCSPWGRIELDTT